MLGVDKRPGVPGPAALFLIPFAWLISMSLKPESQVFSTSVIWIPHPVMWSNYVAAVNEFPFLRYFTNTMIICVAVVIGSVASTRPHSGKRLKKPSIERSGSRREFIPNPLGQT